MRIRDLALAACLIPSFWMQTVSAAPIEVPKSSSQRPLLKSIYAGLHQISDFKKSDTKALVFVFLSVDCPVSRQYATQLGAIHRRFQNDHVQVIGIYPSSTINILSMATDAFENDFPFPVFHDQGQRLAKLLEVSYMPEVVVLDAKREKRYQGAIDDQYKKRGRIGQPQQEYLVDALTSILANKAVERDFMPASGCPIEYDTPPSTDRKFTFYKHIQPILQNNCQGCHHKGGVAPFELITYKDAASNISRIKEAVDERRMPPWHGFLNPAFGKLAHEQRLSENEIETLINWCEHGAPEGNPSDAKPPITFPDAKAWQIGKPDYVYQIDTPFKVPKTGTLEYQFFRVKMDFPEDRWFRAVEVKPGDAEVVHHVALHIVETSNQKFAGLFGMTALYGINTERGRLINDYVPGDTYNAKVYPSNQAVRIPKHSDLMFEVHYTPNGRSETLDQSKVAFQWADKAPEEEVFTQVFRKSIGRFRVPAYASHYRVEDTYHFEHDVLLDAVRPHFHLRGKTFRLELIERNATTDEIEKQTTILSVPIYDPGWQRTYELATPLFVRAGTELRAVGHFDNTELNPNNPNPAIAVEWGQQTTDEMFSTRFKYRAAKPQPRVD